MKRGSEGGDTSLTLADAAPFLTVESIQDNLEKYAGKTPRNHPLMSPIYAEFEGFPPLLIQVGTREILLSDSVRLARRAREAGVDVTLDVWEGMWHSFHNAWAVNVPESRQACEFMADFLRKHLPQAVTDDVSNSFKPEVPKVWDEEALASLELPLADDNIKPEHATAEYYYNLPVRKVYRQYPVYAPGHEPPGYFEDFTNQRTGNHIRRVSFSYERGLD